VEERRRRRRGEERRAEEEGETETRNGLRQYLIDERNAKTGRGQDSSSDDERCRDYLSLWTIDKCPVFVCSEELEEFVGS
jgi:hypothetical protein